MKLVIGREYPSRKSLAIIAVDHKGEHILGYMTQDGVDFLRKKMKVREGYNLSVDAGDPLAWGEETKATSRRLP
jgi:hypothetical protein